MKRDPRLYLDDILDAVNRILEYTKGLSFEQFSKDKKTVDAVVRNFEVIGEATKSLPPETKQAYTNIPWRMMAGTRDKLIHEYFGVNFTIVWKGFRRIYLL